MTKVMETKDSAGNILNDGARYLWWQKVDVDAKVKGATIKLTK